MDVRSGCGQRARWRALIVVFFFQAEDGIRDIGVTGVQTCALPILFFYGGYPEKNTRFGESYDRSGKPQSIKTSPMPTPEETRSTGVIPELDPLFRWETSHPGNGLRVFERGGRKKAEIGNPNREENPGKPDDNLSERGFGTGLRTAPVFLGLQKTRLLDPVMSFPGTNDHPGDYRARGCTAS